MKIIAVYGSAIVEPDTPHYQAALEVGAGLARAGYAVMTGGYGGVMEAASKGAAEAGGHVIGVTSERIETFRPRSPNPWVREEIKYPSLRERLLHLIDHADGYVVMPGGIGTLNELFMAWELVRLGETSFGPMVCYGEYWRPRLAQLIDNHYIHSETTKLLHFADTPQEIVTRLQNLVDNE
ncbi:MAG: TIGR00730 family Rossman fold protein [Chloroflexi bacterium]|nr:MAG: TIGR00730 family Rossman fold protein [Chloroflexota bacterium]